MNALSSPSSRQPADPPLRMRIMIQGAVQGVGFRPFVYRLALDSGLTGWVNNSAQGVSIEVEGDKPQLARFLLRLAREKPPLAVIQSLESAYLDPVGYRDFTIRPSRQGGERRALILPDIATCPDCLREIRDPRERRYRYPFTNCTNCGPRFTIIEALPYDRPNTTMRGFPLCPVCRAEYENPLDRRFHAQPIACPVCGPHLDLWNPDGLAQATHDEALIQAAMALREGAIVAVKGLGGFHLLVDARDEAAVRRLRERKDREEKPFALMYPDLDAIRETCVVSQLEADPLNAPEAPIVLLERRPSGAEIAPSVAPGNPCLGVMLPYTPLHHLLLDALGFPVVATSGNLSDEPICTDEREALDRLRGIADLFLVHNRPIARHVDDSVARVVLGAPMLLRRARGYAPLPIRLKEPLPPLLAVGGQLKNTIALAVGRDVFLSQHIGDLETSQAVAAFEKVIADFERLYAVQPETIACDAHPDYHATHYAQGLGQAVLPVQHHVAHALACIAEHALEGPVLGVSWDGTGYGTDGTIWGSEFFRITDAEVTRVAHWRSFELPGGDQAVKEPRRSALGLLFEMFGEEVFDPQSTLATLPPARACAPRELAILRTMLQRGINTARTSSAGRLFDAVAALIGLRQEATFEGQAAMELEHALAGVLTDERYDLDIRAPDAPDSLAPLVLNWAPMIAGILAALAAGAPVGTISARFHNTLVAGIVAVARWAGEEQIVLSGGCFQNRYLLERAVRELRNAGFQPYWPQQAPPNDGGIALGQIVGAARLQEVIHVPGDSR